MYFVPFLSLYKYNIHPWMGNKKIKTINLHVYEYMHNNGYNAIFILKRSYTIKDMQNTKKEGYQNNA